MLTGCRLAAIALALEAGYRWFESIHPEFFKTLKLNSLYNQLIGENKDVHEKKAFSENNERENKFKIQ